MRVIKAKSEGLLPRGKIAAVDGNNCVVWIGNLGDPIEDIEADGLVLSPADYDEFCEAAAKRA